MLRASTFPLTVSPYWFLAIYVKYGIVLSYLPSNL
jgi:hypothetical protein